LFNVSNPDQIIFTSNTTEAINLALKGIVKPGDSIISGSMEHNSVARPLEALKGRGVEIIKVATSPQGGINPADVEKAIQSNTKMIVLNHASNVTGTLNPIGEIGQLCRKHKIIFLVDAAQTAGNMPIDVQNMKIDLLAFPGHKGLLGPQGVGGLYISPNISPLPLKEGGTGSESQSLLQPQHLPDRYESGTPNTPGIAGLGAGVKFILQEGLEKIRDKDNILVNRLLGGLQNIPGVKLYGPSPGTERAALVSINIEGIDSLEAALILDQAFDIAVRAGLHCAPDAHKVLGTLDKGTIRLSLSYFNTEEDIDSCLAAITSLAGEYEAKEGL
jgi:cysteine desulfurase family protein